jgi:uncharacterized cupin superfamily protein/ribosomal protein S18 acetylase RimI-like enzyme
MKPGMNLVIRPAICADEAAIAGLHAESWRDSYRGVLPDAYLDGPLAGEMHDKWRRRLGGSRSGPQPGWLILISTIDDVFAGFYASLPDPDDPSRDLIDNLHVMPALRSHGIGAALMREGADRLVAIGRQRAILRVVEGNHQARGFYRDLGGIEGAPVSHAIGGGHAVALIPYTWNRMQDLATAARRHLTQRLAPPLSVTMNDVAALTGATHPVADGIHARPRRKQRLGDAFGLTDYGVNRVELDPGIWSSIPHFHSREDEFVLVLEGELVLVSGARERLLRPGDCAGFPAGLERPHHLENRSAQLAVYLEVGTRREDCDECDYPGEDLRIAQRADGTRDYVRRDGTPVKAADPAR